MSPFPLVWQSVESKSAFIAALERCHVAGHVQTEDANHWGYFTLPDQRVYTVAYANLGLPPLAVQWGTRIFVGIDELFVSFDARSGAKDFVYRMPTVFHEIVVYADPLLLRDEVGFVCVTLQGQERWTYMVEGPIQDYRIDGNVIVGETLEGEPFAFSFEQ